MREGEPPSDERRPIERVTQELAEIATPETDQAADKRDRDDVGNGGHEIDLLRFERLVHAAGGNLGDLGFESGHALGDQLGEDGFPMNLVIGRICGGEYVGPRVAKGPAAR